MRQACAEGPFLRNARTRFLQNAIDQGNIVFIFVGVLQRFPDFGVADKFVGTE